MRKSPLWARSTVLICALVGLLIGSVQAKAIDPAALQPDTLYPKVQFTTNMGVIVVELNRPKAPITVDNFLKYVVSGSYNHTIFHRIIADFVVQGGSIDEKFNNLPPIYEPINNEAGNGLKNEHYTIAMARSSHPHSATRQFYFNANDNKSLDPGSRSWGYTVFGSVVTGEEVVDKMASVETGFNSELGWPDVPVAQVKLLEVKLLPPEA